MSGLISNGTYVLGDPNTRELFVQSPLTTGISGTSAYIGVDTSALPGNETVLYDDLTGRPTAVDSTITLSESPLNFDYIEIYLNGSSPSGTGNITNGYSKVTNEHIKNVGYLLFNSDFAGGTITGKIYRMGAAYSGVSSTTWTKWYGYTQNISSISFDNNNHLNIYKVVGINRKEV